MSRKQQDKGRLGPFVPLLKETLASPAWRKTSHGARSLYVCLKMRYSSNLHNNGRLWVSQRDAAREIGSGSNQIARWFRELQHYGLIVQTKGGSLGVEGKGTAPHWRLTECGYLKDPPTRDFLNWNGDKFRDNPKGRPNRRGKNKNRILSRNPVTGCNGNPLHNGVMESHYTNGNKCNGNP